MKYVLYQNDTGEIVQWGECDHPFTMDPNQTAMEGDGTCFTHIVVNGALVPLADEVAAAKALAAAQSVQWETIKLARNAALNDGFTWNSMSFQSDATSQQQIQGGVQLAMLAQAAGQSITIPWTLTDNTVTALTGSQMMQVGMALGAFVQATYAKGVALRNAINAAASTTDVTSVVWID